MSARLLPRGATLGLPFWSAPLILACLVATTVLVSCEDDESSSGSSCANDSECERGTICMDSACEPISCRGLGDCPGSGRTCLADLRRCSPRECADQVDGVERSCPAERPTCVTSGAYRSSCVGDSLSCNNTSDCEGLGAGWQCCTGSCRQSCPDGGLPIDREDATLPVDAGPVGDSGPGTDDLGVTPDMGGPPAVRLCSPCSSVRDCETLGAGAACTPLGAGAYCTSSCGGPGECPSGFECVDGLNQCLPRTFDCGGCLSTGCGDGLVCDFATGECTPPRDVCGICDSDENCQGALSCGRHGDVSFCFAPCAEGQCDGGFACDGGLCKPNGPCDPCGGRCSGATPVCIAAEARCAQCGPGARCPDGQTCNQATYTCEESGEGCTSDLDCAAPQPVCFGGRCVDCLVDSDCPLQSACTAQQTCEQNLCRGILCQRGAQCDANTGRCNPSCAESGCMNPELQCNPGTGQCYYADGGCDLGGGEAMCAPGGECMPNFLSADPGKGQCSCAKETPGDPASPDRIGCQPGSQCIDLTAFMFGVFCGQNIFGP